MTTDAPFKEFDAARRERSRERTPIEFVLGGERFQTLATFPAGAVLDLIRFQDVMTSRQDFLLAVLDSEDEEYDEDDEGNRVLVRASSANRFMQLLYRTEDPVDAEAIVEVVDWISEVIAGRPTERSSGSSDGPRSNGQSSSPTSSPEESDDPPTQSGP